jgi:hypothetical protein
MMHRRPTGRPPIRGRGRGQLLPPEQQRITAFFQPGPRQAIPPLVRTGQQSITQFFQRTNNQTNTNDPHTSRATSEVSESPSEILSVLSESGKIILDIIIFLKTS